jgi:prefoldin subunit 5
MDAEKYEEKIEELQEKYEELEDFIEELQEKYDDLEMEKNKFVAEVDRLQDVIADITYLVENSKRKNI